MDRSTAIFQLGKEGKWDEVKKLLNDSDSTTSVNYQNQNSGGTLLHQAAQQGNESAIIFCLQCGANVLLRNKNGKRADQMALKSNFSAISQFLRKDSITIPAVFSAAKTNQWNDIESLFTDQSDLAGKAVRFQEDPTKYTLLHFAVRSESLLGIRLCLTYGGDLEACAKDGTTPLSLANHAINTIAEVTVDNPDDESFFNTLSSAVCRSVWRPVANPGFRAASNKFSQHEKQIAISNFMVAYAGGEVDISVGETYYTDRWGRALIGWGGSYNPPSNMDGDPCFDV